MSKEVKTEKREFKIHTVTLHQAVNFPGDNLAPIGMSKFSYSSAGTEPFVLTPHPMGVKIKKSEDASYGLIVGSANIKQIVFTE